MAKQRVSIFGKVVLLLNILAVAGLMLSYLASYVSPGKLWPIGFFGLAYPVLLIINLLFITYWILAWKRLFLISFLAVCLGFPYIINTFQLRAKEFRKTESSRPVRILSYNVRLFDLYNWTKDTTTRSRMLRLIAKNKPDIACIQEFYSSRTRNLSNGDSMIKAMRGKYAHIEYTESLHQGNWGMATFSKHPIIHKGKIDFKTGVNNLCIYSDIVIGKDTVRVYNVHFQSIRFQSEDYEYVKSLGDNNKEKDIQGSKKIMRRIKVAFIKRARQVEAVKESIQNSPFPVIVCGDFNDTPSSYTYHALRDNLKDAFVESGTGIGNTYNGIFPSFRIDYILHDMKFNSYSFKTLRKKFSDHFPVTCILDLNP